MNICGDTEKSYYLRFSRKPETMRKEGEEKKGGWQMEGGRREESTVDIYMGNWLTGLQRPRRPHNMPLARRGTRKSNGITIWVQRPKNQESLCLRVRGQSYSSRRENKNFSSPTCSHRPSVDWVTFPQWRRQGIFTQSLRTSRNILVDILKNNV